MSKLNKKMRLCISMIMVVAFVLMSASVCFATTKAAIDYTETVKPIVDLLEAFLKPMMLVVGAAGTLYCVILGVKYARAEEPQDREKAKQHLKGAIIGFVLIFILIVALKQFIGPLVQWVQSYKSTL